MAASSTATKVKNTEKTPAKVDKGKIRQSKIADVNEYKDRMAFEIVVKLIVMVIVAVFLYLSYFGLGGIVGRVLGGLFFGIFGWSAWILPVGTIVGYVFVLANRGDRRVPGKLLSFISAIWLLLGISDLIFKQEIISEYYTSNNVLHKDYFECINMTFEDIMDGGKGNAGILGRIISTVFSKVTGETAAVVIMIALFVLSLFIFGGIELMAALRRKNAYRQEMESVYREISCTKDYKEPSYRVSVPSVRQTVRRSKAMMQAINLKEMNQTLDQMEENVHKNAFEKSVLEEDDELRSIALKIQDTLKNFNVNVKMGAITCGPTVTRYELFPERGVRVNKITNLADDLKLSLAAQSIRIEAPIPGKSAVGIEVPNSETSSVVFRELIESEAFKNAKSPVTFAVGKDISGNPIMADIAKMPHLLIAGATGSGKSVCINTLIMSILYKANPEDVKLIMIDPKVVELSVYSGIPHLFCPVVTDPKEAAAALNWAVREMMDRYDKFTEIGVRNISGYNKKIETVQNSEKANYTKMPFLVIIVDEFADLMMVASKEVEESIRRLAQLARAAGIHLVLATQRPSVNVITGVIKANIPSRIAFSVSSAVDSRTIIDKNGAEKLIGKGDMLFFPSSYSEPVRVQGSFVSDKEISDVVSFLRDTNDAPVYNEKVTKVEAVNSAV